MMKQFVVTGGRATGKTSVVLGGGPWDDKPQRWFGVCLLPVLPVIGHDGLPDVRLPIEDFGTPANPREVREALKKAIAAALDGKLVYVGCMGGLGRTGLFLALLVKALDAYTGNLGGIGFVAYVRSVYDRRAVETFEQAAYVAEFDVASIRRWIVWFRFKRFVSRFVKALIGPLGMD